MSSAHGRVDVNSEGTADEHGGLEAGEPLQLHRNRACGFQSALHLPNCLEQARMVRGDLDRFNKAILAGQLAKFAANKPVYEPREPAGFRRFDAFHVSHEKPPLCESLEHAIL